MRNKNSTPTSDSSLSVVSESSTSAISGSAGDSESSVLESPEAYEEISSSDLIEITDSLAEEPEESESIAILTEEHERSSSERTPTSDSPINSRARTPSSGISEISGPELKISPDPALIATKIQK